MAVVVEVAISDTPTEKMQLGSDITTAGLEDRELFLRRVGKSRDRAFLGIVSSIAILTRGRGVRSLRVAKWRVVRRHQ